MKRDRSCEGWPAIRSSRVPEGWERRMVELVGVEPTCRELAAEVSYDSLSQIFVVRDKGQTKNPVRLALIVGNLDEHTRIRIPLITLQSPRGSQR